jgi:hypothetical protein
MLILLDESEPADVAAMYVERQRNSQAIGWPSFEAELEKGKPGLLGKALEEVHGEPRTKT